MAFSFVGTPTSAASSSTSISLNKPSGLQAGDILFNVIWLSAMPDYDLTPSEAFTYSYSFSTSGDWARVQVMRWASGTDAVSWSIAEGDSYTGGACLLGVAFAVRGAVATGSPFSGASTVTTGTDTSIEVASLTTTAGHLELLIAGARDDNDVSDLSGWTALLDAGAGNNKESTSGSPDAMITVFYRDAVGGASGVTTLTQDAADAWGSIRLTLEPAPSATTVHPLLTLGVGD